MKYGVIDVGGGLRGIYGAGVLDRCLEEDLRFDLCIGVSAGSANMASYLAGQHGRNKPFYDEYSFRREYMSVHNLIHKHSYLDLGYVYGTLSNAGGENPLDYAALARSPAELCVVAANAQNGEAQYFTKADLHPDDYRILMASCCIPVIDQPCVIDGVPYFDGGLADPVPLEWAFAHGCDRVALILTKPIGLVRSDALDEHLAHLLQSHYPAAAEGLRRRAGRYNTAVQRARELERQGLVCIIAPDSTEGMSTLTKNRAGLEKCTPKANRMPKHWCGGCKTPNKMNRWVPGDETRLLPLTISAPDIIHMICTYRQRSLERYRSGLFCFGTEKTDFFAKNTCKAVFLVVK